MNLERVGRHADRLDVADEEHARIRGRIEQLRARIDGEPKSRGWRLRDRVGDRKRWYALPEEVD